MAPKWIYLLMARVAVALALPFVGCDDDKGAPAEAVTIEPILNFGS